MTSPHIQLSASADLLNEEEKDILEPNPFEAYHTPKTENRMKMEQPQTQRSNERRSADRIIYESNLNLNEFVRVEVFFL